MFTIHPPPRVFKCGIADLHADTDAGIIHEDVDAAELRDHRPQGEFHRRRIPHVADDADHPATIDRRQGVLGLDDAVVSCSRDRDHVAGAKQCLSGRIADAARAAGD
jgi:hypothetical protein